MELQRRMVRDDRIIGQLRGHEVWVHHGRLLIDTAGNSRIETTPDAHETASRQMKGEEVVARVAAAPLRLRVGYEELLVREHGMA